MARRLLVLLALVSLGDSWHVTVSPHAENVGLVITTTCPGFFAFNWFALEPHDTQLTVRKVPGPEPCVYSALVMLGSELPDDQYIGEALQIGGQTYEGEEY